MPQLLRDIFTSPDFAYVLTAADIVLIIVVGYLVLRVIDSALKRLPSIIPSSDVIGLARVQQRANTLRDVILSVSRIVVTFVVVLMIAQQLDRDITTVLSIATIAGVAIAFGAQSLVKDVISGFFILLEDQY